MPLLDSVLLDPHKSALNVWIALRTDGVKGSGTESDPYNGSPRYESSISVSTLTRFGREAAATTATNHGYANGDVVTISGVTGTGAPFYNGTFVIYSVMATSFKYWMKAEPGASGSGTITCARTFYQFDELLINVSQNTAIHLGPGLFLTRGYGDQVAGAQPQPKSGQQIIGSGMGVTTLKLVNASVPNSKYWVIATATHLQQVEISDLTLDCNLDGQLIANYTFAPIGCSGVYVSGAHLRYRRVRAINFGTLDPPQEPFVLWSAGAYPNDPLESVDCAIEDCIVEQPAINQ